MIRNLASIGVKDLWTNKIIQGYFGRYRGGKTNVKYCLLSRRSSQKGGTRFNSRGLNELGYVANYVETEQFITILGKVASYLQIRGSPPMFWKQEGVVSPAKLTKTLDFAQKYYNIHFDRVDTLAKKVHCVNLVSKTKAGETLLADSFKELIETTQRPNLTYEHLDFHQITEGTNFSALNEFVLKSRQFIADGSITIFEFEIDNYPVRLEECYIHSVQENLIRTNCVDCLDRTNAFQTKLAFLAGILLDDNMQFEKRGIANFKLGDLDRKSIDPFIAGFKNVWADNGDYISKIYTGTGATTSSTTRKGSSGLIGLLDHKMKSIGRYYIGNYEDNNKQKAINLILGEAVHPGFAEKLEKQLKSLEPKFMKKSKLKLGIVSWCSYVDIKLIDKELIAKLTAKLDLAKLDILVVGIQEAIKQGFLQMSLFSTDVKTIACKYEHEFNSLFAKHQLKLKKYTTHYSKGTPR